MALSLAACGEKLVFDAAADYPDGTFTMCVMEVGKSGGAYYAVVQAPVESAEEFTFLLAEDFTAQAFEPGADGALYKLDYNSPADFYTQWYRLARERDALGMAFGFVFEDDALVYLEDVAEPSPPDGPPYEAYGELPEGVAYVDAANLQSDPGENPSAPEAALRLFNAITELYDDYYTPGDAVTITLTGLEVVDDEDAYLFTMAAPGGESKHAVNYAGDVYVLQGEEYELIAVMGAVG